MLFEAHPHARRDRRGESQRPGVRAQESRLVRFVTAVVKVMVGVARLASSVLVGKMDVGVVLALS